MELGTSQVARLVAVAAACAAAMLPAAPAAAVPPVVEVEPFDEVEVVAPGEPLGFGVNPCPFTVTLRHEGTFVSRTFLDRDGTPIRRLTLSAGFTETYSANGRTLVSISVGPAHFEATDGQLTSIVGTGNQRHVIVPGAGPVLAQAGWFSVDLATGELSEARGLDIPAGSEFCAALSP